MDDHRCSFSILKLELTHSIGKFHERNLGHQAPASAPEPVCPHSELSLPCPHCAVHEAEFAKTFPATERVDTIPELPQTLIRIRVPALHGGRSADGGTSSKMP